MKRTTHLTQSNQTMPDSINCSPDSNFTRVPNELLRNPNITIKAKGILAILLSNRKGWKSYKSTLKSYMKEGIDAINSGIKELEELGYIIRLRYRNPQSKKFVGTLWVYTDNPDKINLEDALEQIQSCGFEPVLNGYEKYIKKPQPENPHVGKPALGNPGLIIHNKKNINKTNISSSTAADGKENIPEPKKKYIRPNEFDMFYKLYPRKVQKGKALDAWLKICNRKDKTFTPSIYKIIKALKKQIKSKQWKDSKFIPHPSTWLNQKRWLDEPNNEKYDDFNESKIKGAKLTEAALERFQEQEEDSSILIK